MSYTENPSSAEHFGRILQEGLPGLIEADTAGEIIQLEDEDTLTADWEHGFTVKLSNGAEFRITIQNTQAADEEDFSDDPEDLIRKIKRLEDRLEGGCHYTERNSTECQIKELRAQLEEMATDAGVDLEAWGL